MGLGVLQFGQGVMATGLGKGGADLRGQVAAPSRGGAQTGAGPVFLDLPLFVIFRALDAFGVDST